MLQLLDLARENASLKLELQRTQQELDSFRRLRCAVPPSSTQLNSHESIPGAAGLATRSIDENVGPLRLCDACLQPLRWMDRAEIAFGV